MLYILMSTLVYQRSSKCFSFLQVETNGYISFAGKGRYIDAYVLDLTTDVGDSHVYYREVTSGPLLITASNHVKQCNSGESGFSASWVFIATWEGLTYNGGDETTPVSVSNMTSKVNV